MAGPPIIETQRLILREFDEDDLPTFLVLLNDPEINRWTGDTGEPITTLEQAKEELYARPIADYRKYGYGRWACVEKATNQVIGFSGLKYLDDLKIVDLGYRLLPSHWGNGYATESGKAVVDYGFQHLKMDRIFALVFLVNVASVRVLEKIGFQYDQTIDYDSLQVARYIIEAKELTS